MQLAYHHSHFLAITLDFTSFFTMAFFWGSILFYSWAVFGLDFTSFCNCMLNSWHLAINFCCYLSYFLIVQADICSALHVYHVYFKKNIVYVLYMSMIAGLLKVSMKQLNTCSSFQYKDTSAINHQLSNFQPSWIL